METRGKGKEAETKFIIRQPAGTHPLTALKEFYEELVKTQSVLNRKFLGLRAMIDVFGLTVSLALDLDYARACQRMILHLPNYLILCNKLDQRFNILKV